MAIEKRFQKAKKKASKNDKKKTKVPDRNAISLSKQ